MSTDGLATPEERARIAAAMTARFSDADDSPATPTSVIHSRSDDSDIEDYDAGADISLTTKVSAGDGWAIRAFARDRGWSIRRWVREAVTHSLRHERDAAERRRNLRAYIEATGAVGVDGIPVADSTSDSDSVIQEPVNGWEEVVASLPPTNRLTQHLQALVTPEEAALVHNSRATTGETVSAFLRRAVLAQCAQMAARARNESTPLL